MITCFIRYELEPYRQEAFATYARMWGQTIPACGANLIGYFGPHEGSLTTAYGVYSIDDLAAYEADKAAMKTEMSAAITRLTAIRDAASPTNAQVIQAVRDLAGYQLQIIKAIRRML